MIRQSCAVWRLGVVDSDYKSSTFRLQMMQILGILPQKVTHPFAHIVTDMEENKSPKGDLSSKRKLLCQRRSRRKLNLMKKACDYSKMFDADVCVGIRLRETGEVMFLSADPLGFWDSFRSRLESYYPTPHIITSQDIATNGTTVMRKMEKSAVFRR
ncbi:hypothetical protein VI817_007924 [Penicillium citrinum]|nr:hypothetical protein VI817_007924 [Penicillium citrinum]